MGEPLSIPNELIKYTRYPWPKDRQSQSRYLISSTTIDSNHVRCSVHNEKGSFVTAVFWINVSWINLTRGRGRVEGSAPSSSWSFSGARCSVKCWRLVEQTGIPRIVAPRHRHRCSRPREILRLKAWWWPARSWACSTRSTGIWSRGARPVGARRPPIGRRSPPVSSRETLRRGALDRPTASPVHRDPGWRGGRRTRNCNFHRCRGSSRNPGCSAPLCTLCRDFLIDWLVGGSGTRRTWSSRSWNRSLSAPFSFAPIACTSLQQNEQRERERWVRCAAHVWKRRYLSRLTFRFSYKRKKKEKLRRISILPFFLSHDRIPEYLIKISPDIRFCFRIFSPSTRETWSSARRDRDRTISRADWDFRERVAFVYWHFNAIFPRNAAGINSLMGGRMIRDSGIQITRFIAVFSNHDLSFFLYKKLKGSLLVRCRVLIFIRDYWE